MTDSYDSRLFAGTMLWPTERPTAWASTGSCEMCGNPLARGKSNGQRYCRDWRDKDGLTCFDRHRREYMKDHHHNRYHRAKA